MQNLDKFEGEWVVFVNNRIVAYGKDMKKVLEKAKAEYPKKETTLMKVPRKALQIAAY